MKVVITKPDENYKAGDIVEASGQQLSALLEHELAVPKSQWDADRASIEQAVVRAKDRGVIAPKDEKVLTTTLGRFDQGKITAEAAVELLDGLTVTATSPVVGSRVTRTSQVEVVSGSLEEVSRAVVQASAPQNDLIRAGDFKEASKLALQVGTMLKQNHLKIHAKGEDFMLRDTIRAATYTDPNSQVGSLAGDLIVLRNLGYLVYKLPWLGKLTTDMSAEPAMFGQSILTRYITPPAVLTWVPGVGFTKQAQQISDSETGTTQSGGKTLRVGGAGALALDDANAWGIAEKSAPSTTDRSVTLNMFKATEIEFPVSALAGTIRNLFGEQLGAQTYSLAEEINKSVLTMLMSATWSGIKTEYVKSLANWDLSSMIGVKNAMTISKIPDVGRFALLHSFYHDKILEDSNLLSAKAILALINKDEKGFESGEIPTLFGVKPLESQLASADSSGALTTWTDDQTLGTTTRIGFAGNASSGLFVSRPPQDFTKVMTQLGIPVTASIRLMTEPDSGLTVMVFSYADNGRMSLNQRVCLMWGSAQGDPRIGILLKAISES